MTEEKWTIRGVSVEALEMICEVRDATGIPFGRLVTEAIELWYENLDVGEPVKAFRLPDPNWAE